MSLSPQWLDELRSRITLSTLIGRHVKIQRAGREYKACCPFHHEKTPSFTINDEKGFYHCFGCGVHGDAIRFLTDNQGLGFMDAVKELAAEAGMSVPAPDPQAAKQAEARATLHDICNAAQNWFVDQLHGPNGAEARDYLRQRGLSSETLARFGFGFAPDQRGALRAALGDLGEDLLVEAGLLIKVEDKQPYDRFRGRIMIPIRDARGRVIAFGGRIMPGRDDDRAGPKYLNSPDTPLFDKGRMLYNLDRASPAARRTGRVIVVEGYMDVIALAQAGFEESVAPLGTALTEQQIELLWKMVERPVLCFDGDSAGRRAAMRAAGRALPMLRPGHSLGFATLPPGMDPDDLVRDQGAGAFGSLIEKPQGLLDRLWQAEFGAQSLATPEDRAGFKHRLMEHVGRIADNDIRELYRREFNDRFSAMFFARRQPQRQPFVKGTKRKSRFDGPDLGAPPSNEARDYSRANANDSLVCGILAALLQCPALIGRYLDRLMAFRPESPEWRGLLEAILAANSARQGLDTQALITILGDYGERERASLLLKSGGLPFSFCKRNRTPQDVMADTETLAELDEAIEVMVTRPKLKSALREVTRRFEQELDDDLFVEQQRLRRQTQEFDQRLMELTERVQDQA